MARYRVWRRIGWTALTLAVAAGLVWVAFFSPLLALDPEQVQVSGRGHHRRRRAGARGRDRRGGRAAAADRHGGPARGDPRDERRQERPDHSRVWPDGLAVTLTSREPVAAVPQPGDVYALMDAEGVRVGTVGGRPGRPAVDSGLARPTARPARRAMDAALEVLGALPPKLAVDVQTVSAATQDDVRTTLSDGRVIRWGSGAQVELKIQGGADAAARRSRRRRRSTCRRPACRSRTERRGLPPQVAFVPVAGRAVATGNDIRVISRVHRCATRATMSSTHLDGALTVELSSNLT